MPRNHGCISNHLKNHDLYTTSWCHWCRGGMIRSLRRRDVSPGWVGKGTQWRIRNGAGGEKASRVFLVHCCLGRPVRERGRSIPGEVLWKQGCNKVQVCFQKQGHQYPKAQKRSDQKVYEDRLWPTGQLQLVVTSDCPAARKIWVIIVRMNVYFLSISVGCFFQIKDPIRCGDMSPSPRSFYLTFRSKASCAFGYWVRLNSISVGRCVV